MTLLPQSAALDDIHDVIKALAAASKLLDEQLELLQADVLDLMRQLADKEH